jgi:Leukotriene A4 hydrolase, C-terminal
MDARLARTTFERNSDFYHPICRAMVVKILEEEEEEGGAES